MARNARMVSMTITKTIAGTACADSSAGSKARPTKCMCAFCSVAIALTRLVRVATADAFNPKRSISKFLLWRRALTAATADPSGIRRALELRCARSPDQDRHLAARLDRADVAQRNLRTPELSLRSRRRLSHSRSIDPHAQWWRSPARKSNDVPRRVARQYAVRHGRADCRSTSARRGAPRPCHAQLARQREHAARGRTRGADYSRCR